jgi:hypothetical protein
MSFRKYVSNITGKPELKELLKTSVAPDNDRIIGVKKRATCGPKLSQ